MQKEIWKDIPGYEYYYQASTFGRIRSIDRISKGRFYRGIVLIQKITKYGYKSVVLCKDAVQKTILVHKLISMTFLNYKGYTKLTVIDHVNNDKMNNYVNNLQIITHRQNNIKDRKSASCFMGVSFEKKRNKWRADINISNNRKFLGYFKDELDASKAYQDKLKEITKTF